MSSFFALGVGVYPNSQATGRTIWPLHAVSGYTFSISFAVAIPFIAVALSVNSLTNFWKILQNAGVKLALAILRNSSIFRGKRLTRAAKRCSEMLERYQSDKNFLRSKSEEDNANDSNGANTREYPDILNDTGGHPEKKTEPQVESKKYGKRFDPLDKSFALRQGEVSSERRMKKVTRQCRTFFLVNESWEGDFLDNDETKAALDKIRCKSRGTQPGVSHRSYFDFSFLQERPLITSKNDLSRKLSLALESPNDLQGLRSLMMMMSNNSNFI